MGNSVGSVGYAGNLNESDVECRYFDHFLLPSNPTCMLYEPTHGILIIGAQHVIKVFGKPSCELALKLGHDHVPRYLSFLHEKNSLIVAFDTFIEVWCMKQQKLLFVKNFNAKITAFSHLIGTPYIYLGFEGEVRVFDADKNRLSSYSITLHDCHLEEELACVTCLISVDSVCSYCNASLLKAVGADEDWRVVALAPSPDHTNKLLIGFGNSLIIEFDIQSRKVISQYTAMRLQKKALRCLCWDLSGAKFISGHESGEIVIWKCKKASPQHTLYATKAESKRPVERVYATTSAGERLILAVGGTGADEPPGITTFSGKSKDRRTLHLSVDNPRADVVDAKLIFIEPYENAIDPTAIIALTDDSKLHAREIVPKQGMGDAIYLPPPLPVQASPVIMSSVYACPYKLIEDLRETCNISWPNINNLWPCTGGSFPKAALPISKILLTIHENSTVYISDVTIRALIALYEIHPPIAEASTITSFAFDQYARVLVLGTSNGEVFVYKYSNIAKKTKPFIFNGTHSKLQQETEPAQQITTPQSPPSPKGSDSNEPSTEATCEASATSNSPTPEKVQSTESPQTSPRQNEQAPPSPSLTDSQPVQTSEQTSPQQAKKPESRTLQHSPSVILTERIPPNKKLDIHQHEQPPGFQLDAIIQLNDSISAITIESSLSRIFIGTQGACVRMLSYNFANNSGNEGNIIDEAGTLDISETTSSISRMDCFESSVEKVGNCTFLLVAFEDASLALVNLATKAVARYAAKDIISLVSCFIITGRGIPVSLPKLMWKPASRAPNNEFSQSPSASEQNPTAKSEQAAPTAQNSTTEFTHQSTHAVPKYLLLCCVNSITLLKLPTLERVHGVKCESPVAWYSIALTKKTEQGKNQDESCLVALDQGSNMHLFSLMSLRPVLESKKYNLRKIGLLTNALTLKLSASSLDGSIWLFSYQGEVYRCSIFPLWTDVGTTTAEMLKDDAVLPPRRKPNVGGIKGIFTSGTPATVNFDALFNTAEVSAPPPPRAANAHATQNVESARARLGLRTQSEIIPRGKQPTSQLNEIKSTMQENIEKLHERGERLRDLAMKTEEMSSEANTFRQMARQLAEREKNKNWYEL